MFFWSLTVSADLYVKTYYWLPAAGTGILIGAINMVKGD